MEKSIGIIGDTHGKFELYYSLIKKYGIEESIQVGDMGIGFGNDDLYYAYADEINTEDENHLFIRGNHDDPAACNKCPHYLGDWGYMEEYGIFYVGGAWSIDREWRTEGQDWWPDEEIVSSEWDAIRTAYNKIKPRIVLTHDCPLDLYASMLGHFRIIPTLTSRSLNGLFFDHQPEKWIFGHHHQSNVYDYLGTEFRCLNELEAYELRY